MPNHVFGIMSYTNKLLQAIFIGVSPILASCVGTPKVNGVAGSSPAPNVPWTPPADAIKPEPLISPAMVNAVPPDLQQRLQALTVADVVDLALRNNPATHASWSQARASADFLGSARGAYYPELNASVTGSRIKSPATNARPAGERTDYGPAISLNYLLMDFGGRSGSVEAARQQLFAANLTHNATIQNTVLDALTAYFNYVATIALFAAERTAIAEAQASLNAAQQRNRVGLATIADVLQARTALSQEQLTLETTQGLVQAARGGLAAALGLPANLPFDLAPNTGPFPVRILTDSVDNIINAALRNRPDLAAARARAEAAYSQVRVTRAAALPSLNLGGTGSRLYSSPSTFAGPSYNLNLGLSIPLFNGFSHQYDIAAAKAQADAISALAEQTRQDVVTEVFVSYYRLQTAQQRAATADDLLQSAEQSAQVAAGRYKEGVGSILDLLTAQTALANARAQRVQSRWAWYTSLAQLARDAGVLGVHGDTPFSFSPDTLSRPLPIPPSK
ncbi:MAG: TolC family protein [Gemmatimonadaceae bacterium]